MMGGISGVGAFQGSASLEEKITWGGGGASWRRVVKLKDDWRTKRMFFWIGPGWGGEGGAGGVSAHAAIVGEKLHGHGSESRG